MSTKHLNRRKTPSVFSLGSPERLPPGLAGGQGWTVPCPTLRKTDALWGRSLFLTEPGSFAPHTQRKSSARLLVAPGTKTRQAVRVRVLASNALSVHSPGCERKCQETRVSRRSPPTPTARTPAGPLAPGWKGCGSRPPPSLGAELH